MGEKRHFDTLAIHIGNEPDTETGAVSPPIHFTSTFQQDGVGKDRGYDYSRASNPTRQRYEENIASLEGASFGIAFASGMAATTALFQTLVNGDHVIIGRNTYGGTYRMAVDVLSKHGFEFDFVDTRFLDQVKDSIKPNTKWIFVETPTNPMLELCDLKKMAKLSKDHNIKLVVDNTFMSPYGQSPLSLGADVVIHSATKYIGGHSDLIGGVLITNNKSISEELYFIQKSAGAVPSPFDCWMLLRSTKTMGLRVQKQSDNAMELAKRLEPIIGVDSIIYPGLENHPQHQLAKQQQLSPLGDPIYGSIISIKLGTVKARDKFLSKIQLFTLAESLGGVESLVCIPYGMTHGSVPNEIKTDMGLTEDLIRLSVGIEHIEDLYNDIIQAIEK
ncbi:MAG: PLP-dependent transferase [Candidatus Marinimicrobia bacterium]|jgi:cystathionine beta-lyase/cystathionine gamma-synthase|nr:PLP-dependent transferase [Candidatus Neomarinimicrobiota bacterium]MBT3500889.1 PLP-dependent transferase [Candidatus Neomarinimicrobiota bacterium]MBT3838923.1 PLP-dependent transferase [Candidatus Neomarinimicrobiota bacterium]MBT4000348.1 PLP-dependent transferase [Candidatus Neomarinimicrobiota bacterium]MBT4282698.1 PLP-dependent transferase [Candidatus Neomarinimicrobiota bacterium]